MTAPRETLRPLYEVLALRYATHPDRRARENFLMPGPHTADPDAVMPIDYFVWAIRGPLDNPAPGVIVVDTGMSNTAASRRPGRIVLTTVERALSNTGIDPTQVKEVIITHMHFDHAGGFNLFPNATFHVQEREMGFCTGRSMCYDVLRWAFDVDDVLDAVRHVHSGRVVFHDGTAEIAPGITVHHIGGHTDGLQVVRVPTERGWVVLASDATHLWANISTRNPFPIVADVTRMLEGYATVELLADGPDHIIPGHDPLVLARFPTLAGQSDIVRVDQRTLPRT
jgi:glyoxylase-like metal-dependent hydrolase (beta-lactamase superfamily II)